MSAHSRPLRVTCDAVYCGRVAVEEVFNTYNAPQGRFCKKHAALRVRELLAGERRTLEPPPRIGCQP